jgi:argininosuccinate lyase
MTMQRFGRLSRPPHPVLFDVLYKPAMRTDVEHLLDYVLRIDAAHVAMLAKRGILRTDVAACLLSVNRRVMASQEFRARLLAGTEPHRGLYLAIESRYIEELGPEAGGAGHVGRSRNDINATATRMRARDELLNLGADCLHLQLVLARRAVELAETLVSGFTHLQPSQPTTLGHYLAAVLSELSRNTLLVFDVYDDVDRCPMGSAAGQGTSFAIDREDVARLLGFSGVIDNSLDAVASRDYMPRMLASLAVIGGTLTRVATDLQLWASEAYGFVSWPDDLVSTSSMMPQKRNTFVWESVRGKAVAPAGALMTVLMGLKNTPFSNSVEVSAEATAYAWPALDSVRMAIRLTTVMLETMRVHADRMCEWLQGKDVTMTALADYLVDAHGLSFRTAHHAVSAFVEAKTGKPRNTAAEHQLLVGILREQANLSCEISDERLSRALDPRACMQNSRFGGGPSPDHVRTQIAALEQRGRTFEARLAQRRRRLDAAEQALSERIDAIAKGNR